MLNMFFVVMAVQSSWYGITRQQGFFQWPLAYKVGLKQKQSDVAGGSAAVEVQYSAKG